MSTSKKQTDISSDMPKWLMIIILTALFAVINYKLTTISAPIRSILWIVWFVASLAIAYFTQLGQQGITFFKDSKTELLKVVWPSRQETVQMTIIIMIVVSIISILLWGVDSSLLWLVGKLTSLK